MSDPRWRETRPSRPYGGEPGARARGRDPRRGDPDPRGPDPRRRDPGRDGRDPGRDGRDPGRDGRAPGRDSRTPGRDGRDPGRRGPGGNGRDQAPRAGRGGQGPPARPGDQETGPHTRRMPAQPGATGPSQIQATSTQAAGTRPVLTQPGGGRDGMARGVGGRRHARGRGNSRRPRRPGRWGTWQGGLGVCIIVAGAAVGAGGTIATRHAPGALLQLSVVAGTVAAGFAIRPRSGWMIIPVPVLSYLVAALLSGFVFERPAGLSMTALAIAAAQWIADGFFAMALGTVLAAVITAGRWILWRRGDRDKHAGGDQVWPPPARTGRRPRGAWEASAEPRYPGAADATKAPGDPGARGTGSRPGPGPYNFSSGA